MDYTKKVLVIEYEVPADMESAKDVSEFFNNPIEEMAERAANVAKNFMKAETSDLCVGFMQGIEDGVFRPADIIAMAFQHWARPFHMSPAEKLQALLEKMKE